jgi:hypothetical protein
MVISVGNSEWAVRLDILSRYDIFPHQSPIRWLSQSIPCPAGNIRAQKAQSAELFLGECRE